MLRDAEFDITVKNADGRESGVRQLIVDGQSVKGNIVKATPGCHTVEVIM